MVYMWSLIESGNKHINPSMDLLVLLYLISCNKTFYSRFFVITRLISDVSVPEGIPIVFTGSWAACMHFYSPEQDCWKGFGGDKHFWIVVAPILLAALVRKLHGIKACATFPHTQVRLPRDISGPLGARTDRQ